MAQSITRPKNITDAQWNQALELYYAAKSKGDRYPELTVAQAALETGWFKSPAGRYNYFGQKATSGQQGSTKSTKEVAGGKTYSTKAKFRDYSNINEAVDDRLSKWGKKYENANNVEEAIGSIWRYNPNTGSGEGYATDTQYGPKLKTILGSMGVSTSDTGNTYQTYQTYQPWKQYGVDTSINLPMNTGEYQTAPEMSETTTTTKERLEAEQAKAELLQKQREKDFLAEVKDRQDQYSESGYQKGQQVPQQEAELDPSYYQVPQIELPNYEAIRYQQAQNQAQILQEQPQYKDGGEIPQRYKNMGFTHVGQKKEGDGQKKWKVLAKKGDKYKVVQGGYRGMKDFSQHGSKKRQDNFWSRMGGRDSAKANDPFSPLYWHKRLGKWEEGGEIEGVVECTNCGWSWDKSESTEKDMYNCHKCGGKSTGESVSQFQEGGRKKAQAQTGYEVPERRGVSLNYDDKGNVVGESSHRMKTETFDDVNWFSFPTLFQDEDGTWVDMSEQAEIDWKPVYEEAKKRGEVIDFGTDKETALKFGEGSWKPKMQTGGNVYPVNYLPQAQNGGATRADSLALYNNALNKIEFYKNNPDYKKHFSDTNFKSDKVRKNLIKNYKKEVGSDNKVTTELIDEISNRSKDRKGPLTPAEKSAMEKKLNTVKFGPVAGTNLTSFGDIVAEQYDTYYNPLAPPIYLHPDISPQGSERYISKRFADTTDIPYYDPIAVAPFDVIKNNPKLVAERIKKYGTSGVPKSYLSKPELQPRVEALNLPPIEQTPINIPVQELNFNTPVKAPKSYNVNMQRYNMEGPSDYYNTNQEGVDYERAMQIKAASDAYNKDIEKRYGPQNEYRTPKSAEDAAERLKQLRSEFEVTLNYQTGGEINEDGLTYAQKGTTVYPTVGSIEKTLMEKTGITGFRKKAQEKAQAQGIKGEHNGGLDAVRHAASSAKAASLLPPGLGFIAANTLGAAHEVDKKMYWNETASDLYNNFAGSIIGSIPFIDDDTRQDLVIEAQKRGFLHNVNKLEEGGEINEDGLTYAQEGTTFFPQVSNPFNPGGYQSPFMQQPAKTAVKATPTRKPAPKVSTKPSESPWPKTEEYSLFAQLPIKNPNTINRTDQEVSRKPSEYEYLFETDNSKKIDTKGLVIPKFNGIREGSGNSSQEILNYQQEKNKKVFQEEFKKQEESKAAKELSDFRKEITSKAILEDAIENDEVSLDMSNYRTEKDVMNLQKMLTDKGYNLNPQGKFANNGIDGKLGNVTKNAMIKYNQHNSDSGYDSIKEGIGFIGDCQETQCSEYMQNELFRNLQPKVSREDWNKNTGLYGDAWNIGKNIVKAGGKKVEKEQIKPGDVVTMFTGGRSPFQAQANAAGTGTTHTGLIDKVNPDGSYYILHNNHSTNLRTGDFEGREYRDLVKDGVIISAGQRGAFTIRSVFRPDYKKVQLGEKKVLRDDVKLFLDPKKAVVLSSKEYDNKFTSANAKNKLLNTFIKPLNDTRNKKTISKVFGLGDDEYQSLSKLTLGILGQETSFGTNAKYTTGVKEAGATVSKLAGYVPAAVGVNEVVKYVGGEGFIKNDEVSKGAGRLKYETNFGADDLTELGITQDNFDDEDKAPLTTMYKLATDYKKFLKKGYNKKDAMYRAVTVYNVSLGHVSQGKKIEDWAKNYDVDYTNKVLNYSTFFNIGDNKKQYKTTTDELLLHPNVYKWRKKLEKEKKL